VYWKLIFDLLTLGRTEMKMIQVGVESSIELRMLGRGELGSGQGGVMNDRMRV
jgi:hypothetical protein